MVLSLPHVAIRFPSGCQATHLTSFSCPSSNPTFSHKSSTSLTLGSVSRTLVPIHHPIGIPRWTPLRQNSHRRCDCHWVTIAHVESFLYECLPARHSNTNSLPSPRSAPLTQNRSWQNVCLRSMVWEILSTIEVTDHRVTMPHTKRVLYPPLLARRDALTSSFCERHETAPVTVPLFRGALGRSASSCTTAHRSVAWHGRYLLFRPQRGIYQEAFGKDLRLQTSHYLTLLM